MHDRKKHLKRHLEEAAKASSKTKLTILNEYHCLFDDIKDKASKVGIKIVSFGYFNGFSNALSGRASIPFFILITPSWFVKTASGDSVWQIALLHTLGHEIAHKAKEPHPCLGLTKQGRFRNWVREVRADFWGLNFVENYYHISRPSILKAVEKKTNYNLEIAPRTGCGSKTHPSGPFRYTLLSENQSFNSQVVRCIAKELGYTNNSYIEQLILQLGL